MVDDLEGFASRISDDLIPDNYKNEKSIRRYLRENHYRRDKRVKDKDTGRYTRRKVGFTPRAREMLAREIARQREGERFTVPEGHTVTKEASGGRTIEMFQNPRTGRFAGQSKNITTWEDRWGNLMARNVKTGSPPFKVVDADDRDDDGDG